MKNDRKEEIRREDKKWSWKFGLIIAASLFVGGLCGTGIGWLGRVDGALLDWLSVTVIPTAAVVLMWAVNLISTVWAGVRIHQARALAASGRELDELYPQVDQKVSAALMATTLETIVSLTAFGIAISGMNALEYSDDRFSLAVFGVCFLGALAGLIFALVSITMLQHRAVNLLKELNPEKNGSVFQVNFNKVWLASCDEGELAQIHKAGFQAYRAGHYACLGCWMVSVFGVLLGWMSWGSVLMIGIIWGVLQIRYCISCQKSGHGTIAL